MRPILFWLGDRPVHAFGTMVALAFVAGGLVMRKGFGRKGIAPVLAWWIVGAGLAGGLVGARLHLALEHPAAVAADPLGFLTGRSGLVWYGGLAGGVLASLWPIRRAGVGWLEAADTAAPALALGLAIGRIGCHLAGDGDWGVPTGLPWGVAYERAIAGWPHPPGVRVHPAALYESAALVALAVALGWARRRVAPSGAIFFLYLASAAAIRFAVEFVRTNPALALGLTEAQWTSAALALGSGAWLAGRLRRGAPPRRARGRRHPR